MITKVGTVGVYVDDQHKSVEFWTTKLGFEIRNRTDMQNGSF
jgi:catechol 2,3-dioxygenase-like lactoylglutathione lyase family enzyme